LGCAGAFRTVSSPDASGLRAGRAAADRARRAQHARGPIEQSRVRAAEPAAPAGHHDQQTADQVENGAAEPSLVLQPDECRNNAEN